MRAGDGLRRCSGHPPSPTTPAARLCGVARASRPAPRGGRSDAWGSAPVQADGVDALQHAIAAVSHVRVCRRSAASRRSAAAAAAGPGHHHDRSPGPGRPARGSRWIPRAAFSGNAFPGPLSRATGACQPVARLPPWRRARGMPPQRRIDQRLIGVAGRGVKRRRFAVSRIRRSAARGWRQCRGRDRTRCRAASRGVR